LRRPQVTDPAHGSRNGIHVVRFNQPGDIGDGVLAFDIAEVEEPLMPKTKSLPAMKSQPTWP